MSDRAKKHPATELIETGVAVEEVRKRLSESRRKVEPPKRGKERESLSDAANAMTRAIIDRVVVSGRPLDISLQDSYRAGVAFFYDRCYLCGMIAYVDNKSVSAPAITVQADHITSHEFGGAGAPGHILQTHAACNNAKGKFLVEDYLDGRDDALKLIDEFRTLYGAKSQEGVYGEVDKIVNECLDRMQDMLDVLVQEKYGHEFKRFVKKDSQEIDSNEDLTDEQLKALELFKSFKIKKDLKAKRENAEVQVKRALIAKGIPTDSIYS